MSIFQDLIFAPKLKIKKFKIFEKVSTWFMNVPLRKFALQIHHFLSLLLVNLREALGNKTLIRARVVRGQCGQQVGRLVVECSGMLVYWYTRVLKSPYVCGSDKLPATICMGIFFSITSEISNLDLFIFFISCPITKVAILLYFRAYYNQ